MSTVIFAAHAASGSTTDSTQGQHAGLGAPRHGTPALWDTVSCRKAPPLTERIGFTRQEKARRVLTYWQDNKVFPEEFVTQLTTALDAEVRGRCSRLRGGLPVVS